MFQRFRCLHDLWLRHCAILLKSPHKLVEFAERGQTRGEMPSSNKGHQPAQ